MAKNIENIKEYVDTILKYGVDNGLYIETERLKARKGIIGEEIVTKTSNGQEETKNIVKSGFLII